MQIEIRKIDHFVITTENLAACLNFYQLLGFRLVQDGNRYALFAGDFKLHVHMRGHELSPHAMRVQPGSADLCFEVDAQLEALKAELAANGVQAELGVVDRSGVRGQMRSLYLRDPDGNLIELSSYI